MALLLTNIVKAEPDMNAYKELDASEVLSFKSNTWGLVYA